jgi:GH24 family phage-related lysozyme (muramidase)
MPINRIVSSGRGKAAIAAVIVAASASGWAAFGGGSAPDTSKEVRAAIAKGITPAPVVLAVESLIKPWESLKTTSYKDMVGVWTVCWGETRINGKPVTPGMTFTKKQCDDMLTASVMDYYLPLVDKLEGFNQAPISVQASMISLAYNIGVDRARTSTAGKRITAKRYREACEAATAWNQANGKVTRGIVNRREMGDAQRLGEAELCVSGL